MAKLKPTEWWTACELCPIGSKLVDADGFVLDCWCLQVLVQSLHHVRQ